MTNTPPPTTDTIVDMTDLADRKAPSRDALVTAAGRAAARAAQRSAVEIRELEEVADLAGVEQLFDRVWGAAPGRSQLAAEMLRAFAVAGCYVVGAFDADVLVGACVGFAEPPDHRSLHSHIAGVDASARRRDIGFALKVHQRAWALQRGFDTISWTFDPLVRRNAHFNLTKLGAAPRRYFTDFYGPMSDGINRADASDRLYVRWPIASDAVAALCGDGGVPTATTDYLPFTDAPVLLSADAAGDPVRTDQPTADRVVVGLPADIEGLRTEARSAGQGWRIALRETLLSELARDSRIVGFDRDRGYLIERGAQV